MKYFFFTLIVVFSFFIIWINIGLHTQSNSRNKQKEDIILQLNFLEHELKNNNLGARMQDIFPEGFVFVNALYGLAWCELSLVDTEDSILKRRAYREALYAFNNINSDIAKLNFPDNLNPENGIFYNGWRNYLLSKILCVDTVCNDSKQYISIFQNNSEIISKSLETSDCPYLESYNQQSWPADMFVAMASLRNYDKIFGQKYQSQITDWLKKVKERFDPNTNMIPHKVDSENGTVKFGSRGCSMALSLRMLVEIDSVFARTQFNIFDSLFTDKTFGLPSIREYPKGTNGFGDIDSGPVIFGVGFSATIVMIGTYSVFKRFELADQQYKVIHAFGLCNISKNQKQYLLGELPMADAFIAWGRATELYYSKNNENCGPWFWAIKFHIISIIVILSMWMLYYVKRILGFFKKLKSRQSLVK